MCFGAISSSAEKSTVCQLCMKSSLSPTMALGSFSLLHDTIANNNDNDGTNHKNLITSILYEQHCKLHRMYIIIFEVQRKYV